MFLKSLYNKDDLIAIHYDEGYSPEQLYDDSFKNYSDIPGIKTQISTFFCNLDRTKRLSLKNVYEYVTGGNNILTWEPPTLEPQVSETQASDPQVSGHEQEESEPRVSETQASGHE